MSVTFINSPNPLAATFDLGEDYIDGFGKIVIPKNDVVAQHAPIASHFFSLIPPLARVDLANQNNTTFLTINLGGFLKKTQPDFQWDEKRLDFIKNSISDFFNKGGAVILPSLNEFPQTRSFVPSNNDEQILVNAFEAVARPLAHQHGGDYEFVSFESSKGLFGGKKEKVTATIAVFGACAGCGSFDQTFGKAPEQINAQLQKENSPFEMKKIQPSQNKGALIFSR